MSFKMTVSVSLTATAPLVVLRAASVPAAVLAVTPVALSSDTLGPLIRPAPLIVAPELKVIAPLIVVTGSANFSAASTNANDENMIVIRGSQRAADIYFTEFNRLFNHYYFRAVTEDLQSAHKQPDEASLFLDETAKVWLTKYVPGKLKAKRLAIYTGMKGFTTGV